MIVSLNVATVDNGGKFFWLADEIEIYRVQHFKDEAQTSLFNPLNVKLNPTAIC